MPQPKRLVILGSTGSIGTQTLDIVRSHPGLFEVVGLSARRSADLLQQQASEFGVKHLALQDPHETIPSGMEAVCDLAQLPEADLVVVSVAGVIGLLPTLAAIEARKDIALASKEVLVAAGELVMTQIREKKIRLTPIDSEHSAIFQCVQGYRPDQIHELILTASGGPFRGWKRSQLEKVTVEDALNHPTWRMGGKITIDSANLMNKALETIEARWLFDVPIDHVSAVVHPQSVVHSFVKFMDGSVLGQLGWPNMRLPILYALTYPERVQNDLKPWNPVDTPSLTFEPVDHETFPALDLARIAVGDGGTMPCTFNAANEEAANAFLQGKISFLQITEVVAQVMEERKKQPVTLDQLVHEDREARLTARNLMQTMSR